MGVYRKMKDHNVYGTAFMFDNLGETAIAQARHKDFSGVQTLQRLLETPYAEHPGFDDFASFPPDWAAHISISCSS